MTINKAQNKTFAKRELHVTKYVLSSGPLYAAMSTVRSF